MRHFLLLIAVVIGQSVLAADKKLLIADPIFEEAICKIESWAFCRNPNSVMESSNLSRVS
jgi:hypothetical protein